MKKAIHPQVGLVQFRCAACNKAWLTTSTKLDARAESFQGAEYPTIVLETCSSCHPFYTDKQTLIDTAGRVQKFKNRFKNFGEAPAQAEETKQ